jgi:hypothetical protein
MSPGGLATASGVARASGVPPDVVESADRMEAR